MIQRLMQYRIYGHRWLVAIPSSQRQRLKLRSVPVGFIMDKATMGKVALPCQYHSTDTT
jgi:hypothetical protein